MPCPSSLLHGRLTDTVDQKWMRMLKGSSSGSSSDGCSMTTMAVICSGSRVAGVALDTTLRLWRSVIFCDDVGGLSSVWRFSVSPAAANTNNIVHFHLRRCLASEGIVTLGVTLSRRVCVRRISLGGEGNALYPVLSSFRCTGWPVYL